MVLSLRTLKAARESSLNNSVSTPKKLEIEKRENILEVEDSNYRA